MTYDWNMPLMPGTVVCATYQDFEGKERVGLFCVLYDEQLDNNVFEKKNAICVKISSQPTLVGNYSVRVSLEKNNFLKNPCIVCCSKMHVLHKSLNIYKVLGVLERGTYAQVVKTYLKFGNELERQLIDKL